MSYRSFLLGLVPVTLFASLLVGAEIWLLGPGVGKLTNTLYQVLSLAAAGGLIVLTLGVTSFVWNLKMERGVLLSEPLRRAFLNFFFPFIYHASRLFRIPLWEVEQFLIHVNNRLITTSSLVSKAENLLILLPRCLQNDQCHAMVQKDVFNCIGCGRCDISELKDMFKMCNLRNVYVAGGGEQALGLVKRFRPDVILAVACERELLAGIFDIGATPVIAIPNIRPMGPCYNTRVPFERIREFISDNWKTNEGSPQAGNLRR